MALKQTTTKTVTVGGTDFYIKPFGAFKAANISGELASLATPLIAALIPLIGDDIGIMDIDLEKAAPNISGAFSGISGDKVEKLLKRLLISDRNISVEIEDDSGEVKAKILDEDLANEIFCSDVQDMYLLAFEVIRLNFNGFFEKVAPLFGKVKAEGATS